MLGKGSKHIIPNGGEKMGDESDGIPIREKITQQNHIQTSHPQKKQQKRKSKQGTDGHLKDLKSQTFQHTWQFSKVKGAPRWGADKVRFFQAYKGIGAHWPACLKKKPFGGHI